MIFKALLFSILLFLLKSTLTRSKSERLASLIGLISVTVVAVIFEGSEQAIRIILPILFGLNTIAFIYFYKVSGDSKVRHEEKS